MPPSRFHPCRPNRHRDVQKFKSLNNYKVCLSCGIPITLRHKYSPITFDDEIRLLLLYPGSGEAELLCELIPVRLTDKPSYEAVSYSWADSDGNASLSRTIFTISRHSTVSSLRKTWITKNCETALRKFRDPKQKRPLWVDSVCIDQKNLSERNSQVKIMTDIYSGASRVLVYLGEGHVLPEEQLIRLFDYIRTKICDLSGCFCRNHPQDGSHLTITQFLDSTPDPLDSKKDPLQNTKEDLRQNIKKDLLKFFKIRWFSRVWVLQEIVRAKEAVVFCGPISLNWGYFTMDPFEINNLNLHYLNSETPPILRMGKGLTRNPIDLVDLIFATRTCEATDPRDKIFALLGIYTRRGSDALQPDYSKSMEDVFKEAALYCIRESNTLRVLSLVEFPTKSSPSWVPDLSISSSLLRLTYWRAEWANYIREIRLSERKRRPSIYKTMESCDMQPCDTKNQAVSIFYPPRNVLKVRGLYLDTVVLAGRLFHNSAFQVSGALPDLWSQKISLKDFTVRFWQSIRESMAAETEDLFSEDLFSEDNIPWMFKHCAALVVDTTMINIDLEAIDLLAPIFEKSDIRAHCPLVTEQFLWLVKKFARGRRLLSTKHSLTIGPPFAKEGDLIYCIDGADVPFVVRRQANGDYMFLGEAILQEPLDHPKDFCKNVIDSKCACHSCSGYRQWRNARQGASFEFLSLQ
jgi:Heterokaryon incompatibility protein (HET)